MSFVKSRWFLLLSGVLLYLFLAIIATLQFRDGLLAAPQPGIDISAEVVKHAFLWAGGLSIYLTAFFSVITNMQAARNRDIDWDRQVKENSFALIQRWDDPALLLARDKTRPHANKKDDLSNNALTGEVNKDSDLERSVVLLLNYFDLVRLSLIHKRIDQDIMRKSLGVTTAGIAGRYMHWVKERFKDHQEAVEDLEQFIKLMKGEERIN